MIEPRSRGWRIGAALLVATACGLGTCVASTFARDDGGAEADGRRLVESAAEHARHGRLSSAREALLEALALPAGKARPATLLELAQVELNLGHYEAGLDAAREALGLVDGPDDPLRARAHLRVAGALDELADYGRAHRHFHEALGIYRRLGDRMGEAQVLDSLGTSYRFVGDLQSSLRSFDSAAAIFADEGASSFLCWSLRGMAVTLEDLGRTDEALARYREALDIAERGGAPAWVRADLGFHLGRAARRRGHPADARRLLEDAQRLAVESDNPWAEAWSRIELAQLASAAGRTDEALSLASSAAAIFRRLGAEDPEWEVHRIIGTLHESLGRPDEALVSYRRARDIIESVRGSIGLGGLRSRYTPRTRGVYEAIVTLQATLRDTTNDTVLWSQSGLVFKEQFDVVESGAFFDQETVALDDIARGAAEVLVTSMVEGIEKQ